MLKFNDYLKEAKKCTDEELVGNQHKLDKNKNGKIDADDLKKLRSTKEDEMEGFVSHAQRKAVWASRNEKGVKEEAELDEGSANEYYKGYFAHKKEGKTLQDNPHSPHNALAHNSWKRGFNDSVKENPKKDVKEETEYTIEDFSIEELEEFMMSEEFEQLDEISKKTLGSYVKKASSDLASSIHGERDAEENDDEDERKAMAKRAEKRMSGLEKAGKKIAKEEVEQIDEISKKTLGSYVKKASADIAKREVRIDRAMDASGSNYNEPSMQKALNKNVKRVAGLNKAADKLAKEEVEQIDELSKKTLGSYVKKASQNAKAHRADAEYTRDWDKEQSTASVKKAQSREAGVKKAINKLNKEEVEQIDEISAKTKLSYIDKASRHAASHVYAGKDKANWAGHYTQAGDWESSKKAHDQSAKEFNKANKRLAGVKAAVKSLAKNVKEEASLQEGDYYHEKVAKALPKGLKSDHEILNHAHDHMQKDLKGKYSKNAIHRMVHFHHDNDFPSDLVTAYHHVNKTNEEVEQIDELSKKTLASYIPKAAQSARFSGMTAQDMQNRSDRARNKGMKDSYHRLSMKYKNKAWDREDNIAKAAQKLAKEDVEQIDELSKKTLGSYAKSAAAQTLGLSAALGAMKTVDGAVDAQRKLRNRYQGTQKAITKLAKEETEQMDYLSPTVAFLDSLGEGKIDDLKDRMRMKQATQSAFDKDYKPAEKQHSNITVHKGTSYGAQDNGDEDEKDEKPEAKEKRGRGRPAGSKSGARV